MALLPYLFFGETSFDQLVERLLNPGERHSGKTDTGERGVPQLGDVSDGSVAEILGQKLK